MLLSVDPHCGVPVYRQVMEQIKFHIATGLLQPGAELPATRALSTQLGVNPMTISKAYSFLEKEAVVERRPGRLLIVKSLQEDRIMAEKIDQLRQELRATVRIVQKLSVDHDEALVLFRQMLDSEDE